MVGQVTLAFKNASSTGRAGQRTLPIDLLTTLVQLLTHNNIPIIDLLEFLGIYCRRTGANDIQSLHVIHEFIILKTMQRINHDSKI